MFAAAGDRSFTTGLDLASKLPPCHEILESCSSLVLADASAHACFSTGPYRLEGVRFFAGVPLLAPEGIPIGVVCLIDSQRAEDHAEDLMILEQVGRQGSLLLRLLALGRPESELPGRLGAGMMLRPSLEVLVDAELRLLRQSAGSMELAVVEMDDPEQMREAVLAGAQIANVWVLARWDQRAWRSTSDIAGGGAANEIRALLSSLEGTYALRGVGAAGSWGRTTAGCHRPGSHPTGGARARTGAANRRRHAAAGAAARSVGARQAAPNMPRCVTSVSGDYRATSGSHSIATIGRNSSGTYGGRIVHAAQAESEARTGDAWSALKRLVEEGDRAKLLLFLEGQSRVLEMIAQLAPLPDVLKELARVLEAAGRRDGFHPSLVRGPQASCVTVPRPACRSATGAQSTGLRSVRVRVRAARRRSSGAG